MELENKKMLPMVVLGSGKYPECSRHSVAPYSTHLARLGHPLCFGEWGLAASLLSMGSRQGRRRMPCGHRQGQRGSCHV